MPNNLPKQLMKFKTRDSETLDWMFASKSKMFSLTRLPRIGSSDHYTIPAKPNEQNSDSNKIQSLKYLLILMAF